MKTTQLILDKKPGVFYAHDNQGWEWPIVDVTHPAFVVGLTDDELKALTQ